MGAMRKGGDPAPRRLGRHRPGGGHSRPQQATRAEIEAVRGVGVELTERLLQARAQGHFVDWADLRRRVKGLSRRAMEGFAEAGFRIRGQAPP